MEKLFFLTVAATFLLTGCLSPTANKVTEYDSAGNIVKVTETTESVVTSLMESTKDKTVIAWDNSFLAYLSASTATVDDPTPTLKMGIGKSDKGLLSIKHESFSPEAIIEAARAGDLTFSATGMENSNQRETENPSL